MHRLKPVIALPLAIFAFAGACLIMGAREILSPALTPWVIGAAGAVMLTALGLALRIGIARDPQPEIALEQAIEIICGSARWAGEPPTTTVDHMTDVIGALVQDAATERISMWGANVPIPAFGAIRSALTKIPPSYWHDHQVDLLAFYETSLLREQGWTVLPAFGGTIRPSFARFLFGPSF